MPTRVKKHGEHTSQKIIDELRSQRKLKSTPSIVRAKKRIRQIENYYLSNKKMVKHGPQGSFRLFSLDASDLQVLENINRGVSGRTSELQKRKMVVDFALERGKNEYKQAKKELSIALKKIEQAKRDNNLDLLEEAKELIDKITATRQEITEEKGRINQILHNAIRQLEI